MTTIQNSADKEPNYKRLETSTTANKESKFTGLSRRTEFISYSYGRSL